MNDSQQCSDLHIHSRFSDGRLWPEQIVSRAKEHGFRQLALTDHDTLQGTSRFMAACARHDIEGVIGVEIDCVQPEIGFNKELLGYFPSDFKGATFRLLDDMARQRLLVAQQSMVVARSLFGKAVSWEGFMEFRAAGAEDPVKLTLTKVNVYEYLLTIDNSLPDYPIFKKQFYGRDEFTNFRENKPTLFDVIQSVCDDGGRAVLAHPGYMYSLDTDRMLADYQNIMQLFLNLKSRGLWGVELHSYNNSSERDAVNTVIKKLAIDCGLHTTSGSDSHGRGDEKDAFGIFSGPYCDFDFS